MRYFISPWKSSTPRALSRHLGFRLRRLDEVGKGLCGTIINWGCSNLRGAAADRVFNKPGYVRLASNKLYTLQTLHAHKVPTLEFTKNREEAIEWNERHSIVAHTDVHGHSGSGLERFEPKTPLNRVPYCDLYTKYFPKTKEVRVLCIRDGAVFSTMFLEKKRILPERYAEFGLDSKPDWFIRTYDNGWIFSREADEISGAVKLASEAMGHLGLDFGAVDLLAKPDGNSYEIRVGEVNTAPGLEGQTLEFFKAGLTKLLKQG